MVKNEGVIFLIVGLTTVLLDYVIYQSLLLNDFFDINFSKGFGFIGGTFFSYFANRFWTFKNTDPIYSNILRFFLLYSITLGINVVVNSILLKLLIGLILASQIAFFVATAISAFVNFIGLKFFVFNRKDITNKP